MVKTTGDGMMAVFGGAIGAATASLVAQRGLIAEPWGETGPLRVRMGIHCGEAELRDGDYFGTTVNRAARIMAAGHGGQVLLSASAASLAIELLPAGSALRDLGEHHLRDLGRPEHLYQLVHPDLPADFPRLVTARQPGADLPSRVAALIGRREEIAQISDAPRRRVRPAADARRPRRHRQDDAGDPRRHGPRRRVPRRRVVRRPVQRARHERRAGGRRARRRPRRDHRPAAAGRARRPPARAADAARARQPRAGHRVGRRRGPAPERLPGPDDPRHEPRAAPRPRGAALPRPAARAAAGWSRHA